PVAQSHPQKIWGKEMVNGGGGLPLPSAPCDRLAVAPRQVCTASERTVAEKVEKRSAGRASEPEGSVEQAGGLESMAELVLAGRVEGAERQAQLAVAAAEELHRRLDRDGVGRQAEQVAAEGKQPAVPAQRLRELAGLERADQCPHVAGDDVADD